MLLAALALSGCGAGEVAAPARRQPTVVRVGDADLEVVRADGGAPAPVLVHVPGGGWTSMDRRDVAEAFGHADALADGWAVVTVRYPQAGDGVTAVEQAADVQAALAWIVAEGAAHGLRRPVLAMGHSAGAHLLALAVARSDAPVPDALVLASGVYDFGADVRRSPLLLRGLRDAIGCDATCADSSPVEPATWLDGDEPPATLVHGAGDRVTPPDGSARYAEALRTVDVDADLRRVDGGDHRGARTDAAVRDAVARWRAQLLRDRSSR